MKYYVRTTLERELNDSYSQVEYDILVDKDRQPIKSFIKQLRLISDDNAVLMEDDIILCKDFKEKIEKVISEHPNDVINFFQDPFNWFESHYTQSFRWNQCTYYPKGLGKRIADEMEKIYNNAINSHLQYDSIERMALNRLDLIFYVYRPCLVQHIDYSSLIQEPGVTCRRTLYFEDYLLELGISYDEAYKKENLKKLQSMRQSHFQKIKWTR